MKMKKWSSQWMQYYLRNCIKKPEKNSGLQRRALHRQSRGHRFKPCWSPEFFSGFFTQLHKLHSLRRPFLHFQKRFCYQYYCEPKTTCGMNERYFNMVRESLWRNRQKSQIIGCLSNDYGDVNEKGKKAIGRIDWQNNKIKRWSPFLLFLCRHCTTTTQKFLISHFVEDANTRQDFLFLFLNFDTLLEFNFRKKIVNILMNWTRWNEHIEV